MAGTGKIPQTKLVKPLLTAVVALALAAALARWSAGGKSAWVLLKLLLALAFMVLLLRERVSVGLALLAGALFLGISFHLTLARLWNGFSFGLFAPSEQKLHQLGVKAVLVGLMVTLINFLGQFLILSGGVRTLIECLERLFRDARLVLGAIPAFIGLLPMPGGAMLSAPIVGELGERISLNPTQKTIANYWFRHVWEWWWPLFPAVLIILDESYFGSMAKLLAYMWPFTVAAIVLGWFLILRKIPRPQRPPAPESHGREIGRVLGVVWPAFFVGLVVLIVPVPKGYEQWLLLAALLLADTALVIIHRMERARLYAVIKGAVQWRMLLLIFGVYVLRAIFTMSASAQTLCDALSDVPALLVCFLVPFIINLLTGYNLAGVSMTFPLLLPLFAEAGYAGMAVAYAGAFIGVLASPVHLCLALTREYFHAKWGAVYKSLIPLLACMTAVAAAVAWIAG